MLLSISVSKDEISFIIFSLEVSDESENRLASHFLAIVTTLFNWLDETFDFKLFSKIDGSRLSLCKKSLDLKYLYSSRQIGWRTCVTL